ncbi:DNA primase [Catenuloplanes indicus]|uniref:DNA primase n=1 Tax=Catenuloplanes indicus TaxID=137267 RepID=UPI0027D8B675|nr:DNA primase [Catenuloplanes indicus]
MPAPPQRAEHESHTEVTVAAQTPNRQDADEPETGVDDDAVTSAAVEDDDTTAAEADDTTAAEADRSLWEETRIDPVSIALPSGVGYTLRAYRPSTEVTPTEIEAADDDDPFAARARRLRDEDEDDLGEDEDGEVVILDEEAKELFEEAEKDEKSGDSADDGADSDEKDADSDTAAAEKEEEAEEVPAFLSHKGKLLLFKTPESLVAFVRSGAPHDLAQLDTWGTLAERLQPADVVPLEEDDYGLDLVVENLRGGADAWDLGLLIEAGEVARDLGYALRLAPVLTALSPGSPLDDLDEALRSASRGGIGGFMGRRRLKRIGAQQASLGWRTIIGKISAVVDWRD